jgi:hypothetical protein
MTEGNKEYGGPFLLPNTCFLRARRVFRKNVLVFETGSSRKVARVVQRGAQGIWNGR